MGNEEDLLHSISRCWCWLWCWLLCLCVGAQTSSPLCSNGPLANSECSGDTSKTFLSFLSFLPSSLSLCLALSLPLCSLVSMFLCSSLAHSRSVLVEFYAATQGWQWAKNSNWMELDPCQHSWFGVHCDLTNTTVIQMCGTLSLSYSFFERLKLLFSLQIPHVQQPLWDTSSLPWISSEPSQFVRLLFVETLLIELNQFSSIGNWARITSAELSLDRGRV